MLFIVQGLWKMRMETTTAMTPLPLPRTCSVSALVYRVTRKLVRLTCCCARETGRQGGYQVWMAFVAGAAGRTTLPRACLSAVKTHK